MVLEKRGTMGPAHGRLETEIKTETRPKRNKEPARKIRMGNSGSFK